MELKKDGFFNQIVKGICESEHGRTDLPVGGQRFLVCGPGSNPTEPKSRKSHWIRTGAAIRTSFG
jgi:hypothetical protein